MFTSSILSFTAVKLNQLKVQLFLIPLCAFMMIFSSTAQPSFWFKTQNQIDSFPLLYPNLKEVGYLVIGSIDTTLSDIHDLSPLSSIKKVWADLYVRNNPHLKTLYGLHNIDSVFTIVHSEITNNDSLINLEGLESLKYVTDDFRIQGNNLLQSLHGLENLVTTEKFFIAYNASLQTLDGLTNLEVVLEAFCVDGNHLQALNLPKLRKVGTLCIYDEDELESLSGLSSLDSIGFYPLSCIVDIHGNQLLKDLHGLENKKVRDGIGIYIQENFSLKNTEALLTWQVDSIRVLSVVKNASLPEVILPFQKAKTIGIQNNPSLQKIEFPMLAWVEEDIFIQENDTLGSLGMPQIKKVGRDVIMEVNQNLTFLFMPNLDTIGGELRLWKNAMQTMEGLQGLKFIGTEFDIHENKLISLQGFDSLKYVGDAIDILDEHQLVNVTTFSTLDSIGWNLDGFENGGIGFTDCFALPVISLENHSVKFAPGSIVGAVNCTVLDSFRFSGLTEISSIIFLNNENLLSTDFLNLKKIGSIPNALKAFWIRNNPSLLT